MHMCMHSTHISRTANITPVTTAAQGHDTSSGGQQPGGVTPWICHSMGVSLQSNLCSMGGGGHSQYDFYKPRD